MAVTTPSFQCPRELEPYMKTIPPEEAKALCRVLTHVKLTEDESLIAANALGIEEGALARLVTPDPETLK